VKKSKWSLILIVLVLLAAFGAIHWCIEGEGSGGASPFSAGKGDYYYCPMHPWFHQAHAGNCGICGMTLIQKKGGAPKEKGPSTERKVKFWVDAMNPSFHQDHPGKAPDGMDLVAVYDEGIGAQTSAPEALRGLAGVDLSPFKQQLIGLRTAGVEKKPVVRVIRTVGRYAGGPNDFAASAGDFTARGKVASGNGRYVVADIYALDIPYVKVGQKALVSGFSGSGLRLEGKVSQIYPYDGTQSRIQRVQIRVPSTSPPELFANVEIEAASRPLLSVPADAVMVTGLHRYVFLKKSAETFVPREVMVGFEGDNQWQILSGLNAGETVVEGANFMVDADSKLTANFTAMESQEK